MFIYLYLSETKLCSIFLVGLMKVEAIGSEILALSAKTYVLDMEQEGYKIGCKGANKNRVINPLETYREVLETKEDRHVTNHGFRVIGNDMLTYLQKKKAFSYFYCKREVMDDGFSTKPLDIVMSPWPSEIEGSSEKVVVINTSDQALLNPKTRLISTFEGKEFLSVWHEYAYRKALACQDQMSSCSILTEKHLENIPELMKKIKEHSDWTMDKGDQIMRDILTARSSHPDFKKALERLPHGTVILPSSKEYYWGCGMQHKVAKMCTPEMMKGRNRYGEILNELRYSLYPKSEETETIELQKEFFYFSFKDKTIKKGYL